VLRPGDFFGEDALILDARRNADVVMQSDGAVMAMPGPAFVELVLDLLEEIAQGMLGDVGRRG